MRFVLFLVGAVLAAGCGGDSATPPAAQPGGAAPKSPNVVPGAKAGAPGKRKPAEMDMSVN